MEKQTVYTTTAMKGSGMDLYLQELVEKYYLEKKENVYVFTPQELLERDKQIVGDAFDAGLKKGFADGADISDFTDHPDLEQYLNNLKP